ncbi:MAG: carbamate kinase [Polyangiales bacterium]
MTAPRRVVAALGGNAFVPPGGKLTMAGQFRFAREAVGELEPLLGSEVQLLVAHGNGPQVGHMLVRVERSLGQAYEVPLEVCVAESEGELGYVLQQTIHNAFAERGSPRAVVSLITQVVVARDDPAFDDPTKPIGPFYERERAEELRAAGFAVREERGRGFRRVVPSPEPREVVEAEVIARLLELGIVVVAAGGGGVPVVRAEGGRLEGVDAVVDKDLSAALVADGIGADTLLILTGVPYAYIGWGTPEQEPVRSATPERVRELAGEGHFPPGSMGPKMEAAARFVERTPGRKSIVCDPASLRAALAGTAGTQVRSEERT